MNEKGKKVQTKIENPRSDHMEKGGYQPLNEGYSPLNRPQQTPSPERSIVVPPLPTAGTAESPKPSATEGGTNSAPAA